MGAHRMNQIKTQAERDAVDAHQGAQVWCPYDVYTQEAQYNAWMTAFHAKLIELEGGK